MTEISYRDIPRFLLADSRAVKAAGVEMLNTVGFRSLPDLVAEAQEKMKFRGAPRGALGWQVDKATLAHPVVTIQTHRKWLRPHLNEGDRAPRSGGWVWNGREYIVIPVLKAAFGKGGVMKSGYLANFYVVPHGNGGLVYYRQKRGEKQSQLLAIIKPHVATHEDTHPDKVINVRFNRDATRLLVRYFANPRHRANPGGIF